MQAGAAQIGLLQTGPGEVRLLPARSGRLHSGEIGAPKQRLAEIATGQIGAMEAGAAKAGFPEEAVAQIAVRQIEITAVDIDRLRRGKWRRPSATA